MARRTSITRQIRPPSEPPRDITPNGNPLDATTAPHSVGPDVPEGFGDVHVLYPAGMRPPPPAAWQGWPVEWMTPNWWGGIMGQLATLSDTAFACLDLNSSVLASMPAYRTTNAGEPLASLEWQLNPDPDVYASWAEFSKQLFWHYQLGEAFVLATARYATGWPARFHLLDPWAVNVEWWRGLRRYNIDGRYVPEGDLLHIRYTSSPPPLDPRGHGALEAGRARLVAAAVLNRYASTLAAQGGVPTFAITHPDELTAKQIAELQAQWYASRVANLGLPAVLSGGISIETLQVNPRDMSLVELQQLTEQRIAVLLGVPPVMVALPSGEGSMTYNNVQGIYDYHWRACLRPRAEAVMQALSAWALPRGQHVELNRDEYVRPALGDRANAYATLHGIEDDTGRALTAAEIRVMERFGSQATPEQVNALVGGAR